MPGEDAGAEILRKERPTNLFDKPAPWTLVCGQDLFHIDYG